MINIAEPAVAFTDLLLSIEAVTFFYLIRKERLYKRNALQPLALLLFLFLSISSLLGSIFHSFFPEKTDSLGGLVIWLITAFSIGLIASTVWLIDSSFISKRSNISKPAAFLTLLFLVAYLYTILFIDYHYPTIIKFYAPPILLLGIIALVRIFQTKKSLWIYLFIGIVLTFIAAAIQSLHINIDPNFLNYNTLYHFVQGVALVFLFISFRRMIRLPL